MTRKAYSYIRMSTDIQLKGDSLRRQLSASEKYAENHKLELVRSIDGIVLNDIGVSAFKGKNTQKGVLAIFLDALDFGKIRNDSVLLIESLDRLSRDKLSEALPLFMMILNKGVEIVTLADGQIYTKEIIDKNPGALFVSLGVMFRANEESEMKSKRLSAAWANKRNNSSQKILTKQCPAWLEYSQATGKFEIIKERADVIRKIFDMSTNTCGLFSIARYLNESKTPVFGTGKIWHKSYLNKIIKNRAVIGEYQPHHLVNGKREKIGDPIADYFPAIIDEQSFLLAQVARSRRTLLGSGRKGESFNNLFSGIGYCGSCGFKMMMRNKSDSKNTFKYLVCANANSKAGCQQSIWTYSQVENVIFRHLRDINFSTLVNSSSDRTKISIQDEIDAISEQINIKNQETERALDFILGADLAPSGKLRFESRINQLESEKVSLEKQRQELALKVQDLAESEKLFSSDDFKQILNQLDEKQDDYFFRSSVNQFLAKLIDKIEFIDSPEVFVPWELDDEDDVIKSFRAGFKIRQKMPLDALLLHPDLEKFFRNYHRSIKIYYKSGAVRFLLWGKNASIIVS